jgi:hypothetical protein
MSLRLLLCPALALCLLTAPATSRPAQAPALRPYRGRVVSSSGQALVGATVLVRGTHTATTTNADGVFLLPLPVGTYPVLVDYPGYLASQPLVLQFPDSLVTFTLYSTQPRRR